MKGATATKNFGLFFMGFLGFLGFRDLSGDPLGYLAFAGFAYFSNFWWAKLGSYKDERLIQNKQKAGSIALYTGFALALVSTILIRLFSFDLLMVYRLQVLIVPVTFAISVNLWAFLTYLFDVRY